MIPLSAAIFPEKEHDSDHTAPYLDAESEVESFADSNLLDADEVRPLAKVYEIDENIDELLTVDEELLEIDESQDDEEVSALAQSLSIDASGVDDEAGDFPNVLKDEESSADGTPRKVVKGKHVYSRVVTSFKKSMRLFISCVKPEAASRGGLEVKSKEICLETTEDAVGPWREISTDSEAESVLGVDIPVAELRESSADTLVAQDKEAEQAENNPIASLQQNAQAVSLPYYQKRLGRFIIERHRQLHTTLAVPLLPAVHPDDTGRKCLVLDLDETLIHSQFNQIPDPDLEVPIQMEYGVTKPIYVAKRPGVDEFLEAVGKAFEVVIFTASLASYANPVIDFLDQTKTIKHRLYRDACVFVDGLYLKDLSLLGRPMDQVIIIDNAAMSYLLNPDNGVSIISWFSDRTDNELLGRILPALRHLEKAPDVFTWKKECAHLVSH